MTGTRILLAIAAVVLVGGAALPLLSRRGSPVSAQTGGIPERPKVRVVRAETRPISRTVRLSGTLQSGSEATLSPKLGGRIAAVYAVEGQAVRRGQPLVRLDYSDAQRHAEQAGAGVAAARANWEKALETERLKRTEIDRRIEDARRGVEQAKVQVERAEAGIRLQARTALADVARAQAGVDAAKSTLAQAKKGPRPEQRKQAQIQVAQAQRGVDLAKKNLDDLQTLYRTGGIPRIDLDQAREAHQKALDGLAQARAQLDLLDAGATAEEVATAEAQLRSAEATLTAARAAADRGELDDADVASARARLRQADAALEAAVASRRELGVAQRDVRASRAALAQAEAAARLAEQQVTTATIDTPLDGIVTEAHARVGEMAGPGQPLLRVVSTTGVYLEAAAPSRVLAGLRPGQEAAVRMDSLPGALFRGAVRTVGRVAGPDGRSFPVKIDLRAPSGALKPGGFARAEVTVGGGPEAVTVPLSALRSEAGRTVIWVVRAGRLAEIPVETPLQDGARAAVRGDVRAGEDVVVSAGAGLSPGDVVQFD